MTWSDVTGCEVGEQPVVGAGGQGDPQEASGRIQARGSGSCTRAGKVGRTGFQV